MSSDGETIRERVRKAVAAQTQSNVNVLSSLLAVQDELGYIPQEAVEEVADFLGTTVNEVWGVASFYTNFRFSPPGEHTVEVCWGPTCHLLGAQRVLHALLEELGLKDEGDTPDGRVTLKYNTCLGACSNAPVISVDHRLVGRVGAEEARRLVARLRNGGGGS